MTTTMENDPDYELFCQQRLHNPHPLLARLREQDPVHWCEPLHMWLVTRYGDVLQGIRGKEKRLSTSREAMYTDPLLPENRKRARPMIEHVNRWLLNVDPPHHTRMRKLVNLVFTPRMLQSMRPRSEAIVERRLDEAHRSEETDFIQAFTLPVPAGVICEMLGIPEDRRGSYCRCVQGMLPFSSAAGPGLNDTIEEARASLEELIESFDELIAERRQQPQDDLITAMVVAEADGDRLNRDELFALCVFVFLAGHEATSGLLANGTLALLQHPDQFDKLKAYPDGSVDSAVEEFLRYEPSVTRGARRAKVDFKLGGRQIRSGQTITHLIGASNRDPSVFPDPDRLDITRKPNDHLGFGHGIHFCLGAHLTKLEANIAFRAMALRVPEIQLAAEDLKYKPAIGIRSLESLPVRFSS